VLKTTIHARFGTTAKTLFGKHTVAASTTFYLMGKVKLCKREMKLVSKNY
jgi:hypothetical protein